MQNTALYRSFESKFGEEKKVNLSPRDIASLLAGVGIQNEYVASRVFRCIDDDGNGKIKREELLAFCRLLGSGTRQERAKFLFAACDLNNNGRIDQDEMRRILRHMLLNCHLAVPGFQLVTTEADAALFSGLTPDQIALLQANRLAFDIFKDADLDGNGAIDLKEFLFWFSRGSENVDKFAEIFQFFDLMVAE